MDTMDRDHHLLSELHTLLELVPAKELRNSLEDLFFSYLSEEHVVLPHRNVVRHLYQLLLFLREIESP